MVASSAYKVENGSGDVDLVHGHMQTAQAIIVLPASVSSVLAVTIKEHLRVQSRQTLLTMLLGNDSLTD